MIRGSWAVAALVTALAAPVASAVAQTATDSAAAKATRADSTEHAAGRAQLDAVVVTASRRSQKISDAAVTTELISHDEIARSGAQDLQAVLVQHLGVQPEPAVFASGGVQIQGLSSERVLVLVDGQPLNGRIDGQLDLSRIPASLIERIEVVKGPQSTLYGSAAMGGVVNVITREPLSTQTRATANVIGGSEGRLDANASLAGGTGEVRWLGGFGRRELDVQPGRSDQSAARERRWDGNGKLRWSPSANVVVEGSALTLSEDQRWGEGPLFYFSNNDQLSSRIGATIVHGSSTFSPTLYYSGFNHLSRAATLSEPVSDSGDVTHERLLKAELAYSAALGANVLDAGTEVKREGLETDRILGGSRTLYTVEPYAQLTINAGPLSIVPGARVSRSDQWGTHVSPKLAALVHLTPSVALRLSVADGFRAPDFKELYLRFLNTVAGGAYVVNGNPSLSPESSRNLSGGLEWSGSRGYARFQAYRNNFHDFIEAALVGDSSGTTVYAYRNVDNGVTQGVDVEGGVTVDRLALDAAFAYLDAYDRGTGQPLLGRAPRTARLGAEYELPSAVRASLVALYTSSAPVDVSSTGVVTRQGSYAHLDARLARRILDGLDAELGVMNLFDARPANWPGPVDRAFYAGLTLDRAF